MNDDNQSQVKEIELSEGDDRALQRSARAKPTPTYSDLRDANKALHAKSQALQDELKDVKAKIKPILSRLKARVDEVQQQNQKIAQAYKALQRQAKLSEDHAAELHKDALADQEKVLRTEFATAYRDFKVKAAAIGVGTTFAVGSIIAISSGGAPEENLLQEKCAFTAGQLDVKLKQQGISEYSLRVDGQKCLPVFKGVSGKESVGEKSVFVDRYSFNGDVFAEFAQSSARFRTLSADQQRYILDLDF